MCSSSVCPGTSDPHLDPAFFSGSYRFGAGTLWGHAYSGAFDSWGLNLTPSLSSVALVLSISCLDTRSHAGPGLSSEGQSGGSVSNLPLRRLSKTKVPYPDQRAEAGSCLRLGSARLRQSPLGEGKQSHERSSLACSGSFHEQVAFFSLS